MRADGRQSLRSFGAGVVTFCLAAAIVFLAYQASRRVPGPLDVLRSIPQAAALLDVRGPGFVMDGTGAIATAASSLSGTVAGTLQARAPTDASGAFRVGTASGRSQVDLRLVGARAAPSRLERGAVVYRDVHASIDAVAVHDPERFEVLFLAHRVPSEPLVLDLSPVEGGSLTEEPSTGGIIVRGEAGRPVLRLTRPVAIDAAGETRPGSYRRDGSRLEIQVDMEELVAPIVIDPAIVIPYWSVLADHRTPGALVYDDARRSLESHVVHDATRGRALLVRPVRSQQFEDTVFQFGKVRWPVSPEPRVSPSPLFPLGSDEEADWRRTVAGSETWEWDGSRWELRPAAELPELIDPSLAHHPGWGRTILFGGGARSTTCIGGPVTSCTNHAELSVTYEHDGERWTARRIAGSPPPRVRASLSAFGDKVLLFGGRGLLITGRSVAVDPYGPPFPDMMSVGLWNDTWLYDGASWERVDAAAPPPPMEGAQLLFDARREVAVLVGEGVEEAQGDLGIWEFDGMDWHPAVAPASLPSGLRGRRGVAAFWNGITETTMLFGGFADAFDTCPFEGEELETQRSLGLADPEVQEDLAAQGCLGGYAHDLWQWDGAALERLTNVGFGGLVNGTPVFRQLEGASPFVPPEPGALPPPGSASGSLQTPLWPYRYDRRREHFELRSTLERAYAPSDTAPAPPGEAASPPPASPPPEAPAGQELVSPAFVPAARPQIVFDADAGRFTLFSPEDGRIYTSDGASWAVPVSPASPFSEGAMDFFGAVWDSGQARIVLFDPRTASTWEHSDAGGWVRLSPGSSPPVWSVATEIRRERDYDVRIEGQGRRGFDFATAALRMPRMAFDRTGGRVLMIYEGSLWELSGGSWTAHALPPGWSSCPAATLLEHDAVRGVTVAVGCKVPGETWEWTGSAWVGPFPGPYEGLVTRTLSPSFPTTTPLPPDEASLSEWAGTLQLAYAHPNALVASPAMGGVAMVDADGTLRTWDGTSWLPGPQIAERHRCGITQDIVVSHSSQAADFAIFPLQLRQIEHLDFLPLCFFPPLVEDGAHHRLVAFRDGTRGLLELPLSAGIEGSWRRLRARSTGSSSIHPHPFELLSPEHVYLMSQADPASRAYPEQVAPPELPREAWRVREQVVHNLFWPFRLLPDPVGGRVRVLTHRGAVWELGGEPLRGLGEPCQSSVDCGEGTCSREKVCCDNSPLCDNTICATCKGAQPGQCEPVPAGFPDPFGRGTGTGECAGACPGVFPSATSPVTFDPMRPCGPPDTCVDGILTPGGYCSPAGPVCAVAEAHWAECELVNGEPVRTGSCRLPVGPCTGGWPARMRRPVSIRFTSRRTRTGRWSRSGAARHGRIAVPSMRLAISRRGAACRIRPAGWQRISASRR